jgi:hypothetical protein
MIDVYSINNAQSNEKNNTSTSTKALRLITNIMLKPILRITKVQFLCHGYIRNAFFHPHFRNDVET